MRHEPFTDTAGVPAPVPGYGKNAAEFPIQCRKCLQAWPCEVARLADEIMWLITATTPADA